jgi:hypothetical protein
LIRTKTGGIIFTLTENYLSRPKILFSDSSQFAVDYYPFHDYSFCKTLMILKNLQGFTSDQPLRNLPSSYSGMAHRISILHEPLTGCFKGETAPTY